MYELKLQDLFRLLLMPLKNFVVAAVSVFSASDVSVVSSSQIVSRNSTYKSESGSSDRP